MSSVAPAAVPAVPEPPAASATPVTAPSAPTSTALPVVEVLSNGHANGHSNGHSNGNGNGAVKAVTMNLGAAGPAAFRVQGDAPSCAECGSIMVRNGSCYKCLNCGSTSGCS